MRKIAYILLAMVILAACSNTQATKTDGSKKTKTINVDKGLFNVKVTLPASMFKDQNVDTVISDAKKKGIIVTKNDDGSLTYKMSRAQHKKMMDDIKTNINKSIEDMKSNKDFTSIKDVTHNTSFSEFTLLVDEATYQNSFDSLASLGLGFSGMMYQLFNGADPNNYKVKISVKDQATQDVFDQITYPDALDKQSK